MSGRRTYKPTHVQRMRAGAADKALIRGDLAPIRRPAVRRGQS